MTYSMLHQSFFIHERRLPQAVKFKMQNLPKLHLLFLLSLLLVSKSQEIPATFCGTTPIQHPFFSANPANASIFSHMILCKSGKLYFRTTLGLFPVSSIDYAAKLLTVSHPSCSPVSNFVSPYLLSAGFPPPPPNVSRSNSLALFNCSKKLPRISLFSCGKAEFSRACGGYGDPEVADGTLSCLSIDGAEDLGRDFHPEEMNCSHYRRVYKVEEGFEMGTRISFDIPDHVPNPCDQCEKPYGNCGAGLRCICHPLKCKDKIISNGAVLNPSFGLLFYAFCYLIHSHGGFLPGS